MKKTILLFIIILMTAPAFSQDLFMQLTNDYAEKEGFSATKITSDMFGLYLRKKNIEEGNPVYAMLDKLDNILVVSQTRFATNDSIAVKRLHDEVLEYYKKSNYTLFKTEKRIGEDIKVFLEKDEDKVRSLALVTASPSVANLIELNGDIDLSALGELTKALNIRGLENLNKINNSSSLPVNMNMNYTYAMPEFNFSYNNDFSDQQMKELKLQFESQAEMTQQQKKVFEEQARQFEIRSRDMAERSREMAAVYGRKPIFLSTPGDTNVIYYLNGKKVKAEEIKTIDSDKIQTIDVSKSEKRGEKNVIRITTKK